MDTFYFIKCEERTIQNRRFLLIYLLDYEKSVIIPIYKPFSDDLLNLVKDTERFSNVSSIVTFVIKPNGKIGLDILKNYL